MEERQSDCLNRTVRRIERENGYAELAQYRVFSGIYIVFVNIHMSEYSISKKLESDAVIINHCCEGRAEDIFIGEKKHYLSRGDLLAAVCGKIETQPVFPLGDYHGATIVIYPDQITQSTRHALEKFGIDIDVLLCRLKAAEDVIVQRSNAQIEHIFSELYHVPQQIQQGYFRIKALEVLLFLLLTGDSETVKAAEWSAHIDTIKEIREYLINHCDMRITIEQLAERFAISATTLKTVFKKTYDKSVYSFIKQYKMHKAAQLLRETDLSISVIAMEMGYDNSSKFSHAFRKEFGVNPREYR
ncbi:MAG: helix-turn-helix transcriptional regulator, partial [Clostridia bacterium]|nr:helix-turn-helix transcriptional regulator [Clostridia bacterium]